jgi:two-component system phosphate regulon sensor histidine kinase PhoR
MIDGATASAPLGELLGLTGLGGMGVLRVDAGGAISLVNEAAARLLERPAGDLVRRSLMEAFLDHHVEQLVMQATRGRSGSREHDGPHGRRLVVRAAPAAGDGAWVVLTDVSELERLRRIRSEFVDNLSHELRTPLTNIRLLTEVLMEELKHVDVPERVRERVATIDVETGHLVQMVDELLDLSRIEQSAVPLRQDEVHLAPLVDAALARLRTFAERQGVTLRADVPAALPPVRGDEERLGQLLINLLHNAIKFSPGGGEVTVTSGAVDGDGVVVEVTDHGVGIPRADQERVFERFYKVDQARQRGLGGTGLGLAIARHIVEGQGGRIWLTSVEGEGSTFSFSVPLASAAPRP